jgi:hypothetical protein
MYRRIQILREGKGGGERGRKKRRKKKLQPSSHMHAYLGFSFLLLDFTYRCTQSLYHRHPHTEPTHPASFYSNLILSSAPLFVLFLLATATTTSVTSSSSLFWGRHNRRMAMTDTMIFTHPNQASFRPVGMMVGCVCVSV